MLCQGLRRLDPCAWHMLCAMLAPNSPPVPLLPHYCETGAACCGCWACGSPLAGCHPTAQAQTHIYNGIISCACVRNTSRVPQEQGMSQAIRAATGSPWQGSARSRHRRHSGEASTPPTSRTGRQGSLCTAAAATVSSLPTRCSSTSIVPAHLPKPPAWVPLGVADPVGCQLHALAQEVRASTLQQHDQAQCKHRLQRACSTREGPLAVL